MKIYEIIRKRATGGEYITEGYEYVQADYVMIDQQSNLVFYKYPEPMLKINAELVAAFYSGDWYSFKEYDGPALSQNPSLYAEQSYTTAGTTQPQDNYPEAPASEQIDMPLIAGGPTL